MTNANTDNRSDGRDGDETETETCRGATEVLSTNRRMKFDPMLRTYFSPPNSHRVHEMIMDAADRQIQTTPEARTIVAAGLRSELRALIHAISGNASCAVADEFDRYLELEDDEGREG